MDIILKDVHLNTLFFLQMSLKRKVDELIVDIAELNEKIKNPETDYCKMSLLDSIAQHREVLDDVNSLLSQFGYIG